MVENWLHEMRYDDGRRRDVPDLDPGLDPFRRHHRGDLCRQHGARCVLVLRWRLGLRLASSPLSEVKGAIEPSNGWMSERCLPVSSNPR